MATVSQDQIRAIFQALTGRALAESDSVECWEHLGSVGDVIYAIKSSDEHKLLTKSSPLWYSNNQIDLVGIVFSHEDRARHAVEGRIVNFLGAIIDPIYIPHLLGPMVGEVQGLPFPANWHADIAEFAAALRAVDLAHDTFRVFELGCGWGCWLVNTGVAARNRGLKVELLGVEADGGHVEFARKAVRENGFSETQARIQHAIAGPKSGFALFPKQEVAGVQYGLEPNFSPSPQQLEEAKAGNNFDLLPILTLGAVSDNAPIDLLHMDIQGGEADFIDACMDDLLRLVRYVVIGTHSRLIEGRIFEAMRSKGWRLEVERPAFFGYTENGDPYLTIDGVQAWRNLNLSPL